MKGVKIQNRLETKKSVLSFIRYTEKVKIYIYGFNRYSKYFMNTIPLPIAGFINNNASLNYGNLTSFSIEEILSQNKDIKDIRIIFFVDDFDHKKMLFLQKGFSAIYNLFDGFFFLEADYRIPEYNNSLVFTGLTRFDSRISGIYSYDVLERRATLKRKGNYRDIKNDGGGYIALEEKAGIVFINHNFDVERLISIKDMDLHGIDFCPLDMDYLYVVETACDRIGVYHRYTGKKEAEFSFDTLEMDCRHINDILVTEDSVYLSMFSFGASFEIYHQNNKTTLDGVIVRIDKNTGFIQEVIANDLTGPHTLFKLNDDIYYCDSIKGNLYCNKEIILRTEGFLRGIYCDGLRVFVGQSTVRRAPLLRPDSLATSLQTGIHCLDLARKTVVFYEIPLLDIYGIVPKNMS